MHFSSLSILKNQFVKFHKNVFGIFKSITLNLLYLFGTFLLEGMFSLKNMEWLII
jgi:hypothetical protein